MSPFLSAFYFLLYSHVLVSAGEPSILRKQLQNLSQETVKTLSSNASLAALDPIDRRQLQTSITSTCGYNNGDPNQPRTAGTGDSCRTDTLNSLWGFCPTTVIEATDCGLGGNCVDSHACTSGCGIFGNPSITTWTCTGAAQFCSTVLLTYLPGQVFSLIACGAEAVTDHYQFLPTTLASASATTTNSPSSQTPTPLASSTSKTASPKPTTSAAAPSSTTLSSPAVSSPSTSPQAGSSPAPTSENVATAPATSTAPNNTGIIVGGVIGSVAVICFTALGFYFIRKHRRENSSPQLPPPHSDFVSRDPVKLEGYGPSELFGQNGGRCETQELYGDAGVHRFELDGSQGMGRGMI